MVNPIISQFSKFWILGVVIRPDIGHKILRPMVKELALYDLRFFSYGQKTAIFGHFWIKSPNSQFFGDTLFFYRKQLFKKLEPQIAPKYKNFLGNFKGLIFTKIT